MLAPVALNLENEFVVAAPIGTTWKTLLDLERVAGCLPGARIEPGAEAGTYLGSMRVKLGPVSMSYEGTAKLENVDEASHTAVFAVHGKETKGQGSASATIRNRLVDEAGSTRVLVETELSVTGRPAQFGRGIMQDVAASMLGDFAKCLSEMMSAAPAPASAAADGGQAVEQRPTPPEALAVGGAIGRVFVARLKSLLRRLAGRG